MINKTDEWKMEGLNILIDQRLLNLYNNFFGVKPSWSTFIKAIKTISTILTKLLF